MIQHNPYPPSPSCEVGSWLPREFAKVRAESERWAPAVIHTYDPTSHNNLYFIIITTMDEGCYDLANHKWPISILLDLLFYCTGNYISYLMTIWGTDTDPFPSTRKRGKCWLQAPVCNPFPMVYEQASALLSLWNIFAWVVWSAFYTHAFTPRYVPIHSEQIYAYNENN